MTLQSRLTDFVTAVATDIKLLRIYVTGSSSGDLTGLTTTNKTSLISAINEVKAAATGAPPAATEAVAGVVELATLTEVATGTDTTRAVTVAGVRQERVALKAEILGVGVPAALDTLDELAAAIGDNASYAASITTALGQRVRVDTAAQGLTTTEQSNARTNIDAQSATAIGNPETDLAAAYATAKA